MRLASIALLLLAACGGREPLLEGNVVDIWGNPIEGALVQLDGHDSPPPTDAQGRFKMPMIYGNLTMRAAHEAYIQEHLDVTITEGQPPERVLFTLYPRPEETGFFAVAPGSYAKLEPRQVHQMGSELEAVRGIRTLGDVAIEGNRVRVIFHTPLSLDRVMRMGIKLHRLDFVREHEMTGPLDRTAVNVNLWTATDEIPIEISPMRSRNDFLITSVEELPPGAYAFHTQGLLTTATLERFSETPEELRVSFPFELR